MLFASCHQVREKVASSNLQAAEVVRPKQAPLHVIVAANGKIVDRGEMLPSYNTVGMVSPQWTFKASFRERDRVRLQENQPIIVKLDAIPHKDFEGTVSELSFIPDAETGMYDCYVSFHSHDTNVVYGLSGQLHISYQVERPNHAVPRPKSTGIS